jgi:hypothetical protein
MDFPRTLLLTWQRPDGRYAGAEAVRKVVGSLPRQNLRWAYLGRKAPLAGRQLPESAAFEPRHIHWRLRDTALRYWYEQHWQADALARRIAAWAGEFRPERLWVLAEMGAVTVGRRLQGRLKIPVHATVHDAYAYARFALPRSYFPMYRRSAMRLLETCVSVDAVSQELIARLREECGALQARPSLVFPSSVPPAGMQTEVPRVEAVAQEVRRLALCGSMRIMEWQWKEFLGVLARMPWQFEVLAFVDRETFFHTGMPPNARLLFRPYAATEADLIRELATAGVWACYLGVSRAPGDAAFSLYSLSSKLTAYAAAGLPSVADAPATSAVCRLVQAHAAGVLYDGGAEARHSLQRLFSDADLRRRLGAGALRLCRAEMDLDRNVSRFAELLNSQNAGRRE